MPGFVFDSQSVLKLYLGEAGAEEVGRLLRQVQQGTSDGWISVVNLAEIYHILLRKSRDVAEEKERSLKSFGVRVVPVDPTSPLWKRAASLKAEHSMSLADAFAASTALELGAKLVTGADADFDGVARLQLERV
ncbi:MAG: type II toxin-antitoxin system VapC family toxin [Thaumarchaeota archaeon]|nr:type II toxin-antitoxin system VapC family toxin [Nitrososphaerota archaeon]